jgi:hypothetical protein
MKAMVLLLNKSEFGYVQFKLGRCGGALRQATPPFAINETGQIQDNALFNFGDCFGNGAKSSQFQFHLNLPLSLCFGLHARMGNSKTKRGNTGWGTAQPGVIQHPGR